MDDTDTTASAGGAENAVPDRSDRKHLLWFLFAVVAVMVMCGIAVRWIESTAEARRAKLAENEELIARSLDECEAALRRGDLTAASRSVDAAVTRFNGQGCVSDHADRVHRLWGEVTRLCDARDAHWDKGVAGLNAGDFRTAITEYTEALIRDPMCAPARVGLALALLDHGDLAGATSELREAIRINPASAEAHASLGCALARGFELAESVSAYREAVRLDPNNFSARDGLGCVLLSTGDVAGAVAALREAVRLSPADPRVVSYLAEAEQMLELRPNLSSVLARESDPKSPTEAVRFATLCCLPDTQQPVSAVRLFEVAFAGDRTLERDLQAGHRYRAATAAALAARLPVVEGLAFRRKALAWLREDYKVHAENARSGDIKIRLEALAWLDSWQHDPDLAHFRPGLWRINLSADERAEWDTLWADVRVALETGRTSFGK